MKLFLGDLERFSVQFPDGLDDFLDVSLGFVPSDEEIRTVSNEDIEPQVTEVSLDGFSVFGFDGERPTDQVNGR